MQSVAMVHDDGAGGLSSARTRDDHKAPELLGQLTALLRPRRHMLQPLPAQQPQYSLTLLSGNPAALTMPSRPATASAACKMQACRLWHTASQLTNARGWLRCVTTPSLARHARAQVHTVIRSANQAKRQTGGRRKEGVLLEEGRQQDKHEI